MQDKMKPVITIAIAFVLLIPLSVFAQSSSIDDNCPQGTKAEVRGTEIVCVSISDVKRTCPAGTYQGLDNQENFACRDIQTNQIVDPNTGIMTDSQTGEIILQGDQETYVAMGIAILIFIIIAAIIAGLAKRGSKPEEVIRKGWTEVEREQVRINQDGKCARCQRPPPRWEYDHIDGNSNNNSLSNCQGLCPNCHSVKTYED